MLDEKIVESKTMPNELASSYLARSILINIGMEYSEASFMGWIILHQKFV